MTLDECKKIHKDMWQYIVDNESKYLKDLPGHIQDARKGRIRHMLKQSYCAIHNLDLRYDCAICQYAHEQYLKTGNGTCCICKFCPIKWNNKSKYYDAAFDLFYCEYEGQSWMTEPAELIRDLLFKEDNK